MTSAELLARAALDESNKFHAFQAYSAPHLVGICYVCGEHANDHDRGGREPALARAVLELTAALREALAIARSQGSFHPDEVVRIDELAKLVGDAP